MKHTESTQSRRDFLKRSSATMAGLGSLAALGPGAVHGAETPPEGKLRVALVGTGARGMYMWGPSLLRDFPDRLEFVGLCDVNPKRVAYAKTWFPTDVPTFTDFDKMIRQTRPDTVMVATVDAIHAQYVVRAIELGCDVICEKPFGTTARQCQAMHDAEKKYGRKIIVTFNARYFLAKTKLKELLVNGEIGDIYSIDYDEMLDLSHGASYFRRWHSEKEKSGTLLLSKASHHFDQLNWWIGADPVEVMAYGDLKKYGYKNGPFHHTHCRTCPHKKECEFYWDITTNKRAMDLYVHCESEDGYLRDGCVYRKQIDIYDTMSVQIKYANDVLATYTLNATSPIEGQVITFNGSKGRIEFRKFMQQPWKVPNLVDLRIIRNYKGSEIVDVRKRTVGHGSADRRLKEHIFVPGSPDPLGHRAGSRAGILSAMIGVAGYTSIESGKPVRINDLIDLS